jgi:predicted nucleotidyltransferase/DNA-binding transcriptional ArsR family regulator
MPQIRKLIKPKLGMITPKMGTNEISMHSDATSKSARISVADALFSGTQQRVLGLLFGQPDRSFYANELIELARGGTGAIGRELARLEQSELVTVRRSGNQKHYQANANSPIFAELCGITQKTVGLAEPLRATLAPLAARIHAAFVYGSVAKKQDTASSDVDLMVISDDIEYGELYAVLEDLSQRMSRTINPTVYTRAELAARVKRGDAFASRVLKQPKIWIVGDDSALGV